MMKNKRLLILGSIYGFICLLVIIILVFFNISATNSYNDNLIKMNNAKQIQNSTNEKYANKYSELAKKYSDVIRSSDDPKIYSVSYNDNTYKNANDRVGTFLEKYFTYDSSKSFIDRKQYLLKNKIATKQLINGPKFKVPKDNGGGDYIDAIGLKSKFIDADIYGDFGSKQSVLPIIAKVTFSSGYRDNWTSTATNMYKLSYNQYDGSVSSIEKVSTINVDTSQQ
ncbi:hypothetical protein DY052_06305 [Apilactobacillus timberlakei]|uniref:hypothetical protein n=1 Tax=Apilactobacillus timberlakei TaxID=2008380 RepID=UPI00112682D8|nr:hypothetical protein [Apilactobacillus timberlakei]TPR15036.1 hypothetical protein DY052_06305 [Apilactobacillus timberlakei]